MADTFLEMVLGSYVDAERRAAAEAAGRAAYEADLRERPTYPDGSKRKPWDQLSDLARWSWCRHRDDGNG